MSSTVKKMLNREISKKIRQKDCDKVRYDMRMIDTTTEEFTLKLKQLLDKYGLSHLHFNNL